jgi:hypothetical protein
MSTSETSGKILEMQRYKPTKGRKPAMRTWPVGCGPTLKKIRRFPDYEQPFELIDEQIREILC